jgi:hypothetical protein
MVLLISYDLNGRERPSAYTAVREMIEAQSASWARPLYSQWFVETADSVTTWHERMETVTDKNDNWLICEVRRPYMGWGNPKVWEWLDTRI